MTSAISVSVSSRHDAPRALRLPVTAHRPILACGADLKNTFALVRDDEAFLGPSLGDLSEEPNFRAYTRAIKQLCELLDLTARGVAHDLTRAPRPTLYAIPDR